MKQTSKAIGFDLDNTLYKETPETKSIITEYILEKAAAILRKEISEIKKEYSKNYNLFQSARRALIAMGIKEGMDIVQEALEKADIASQLKPDNKTAILLQDLAKTYKLFLITGSKKNEAQKKLQALGINYKLFTESIYADNPHKLLREDGTAFTYIAEKLHLKQEELVFVGDREQVDIIPAKKLGITTCIINGQSKEADYNITSLEELRKYFL